MSDNTLHALATDMPTTIEAFGNTYGIGEHKRDTYGRRFIEVIKQYAPEKVELPFKESAATPVIPAEPKEEKKKKPKNQITIQGTTYVMDEDIWESIEWRKVLKKITEKAYWNYQGTLEIHLSDYVAPSTGQQGRIIAMLCRLLRDGYGMNVDEQKGVVTVAQKYDYDKNGQVVAFPSGTFDEILSRFRLYVIQNKRYPFMDGEHDEVALRKWYREVGHGLVKITDEQKVLFENLSIEFADVPKNRSQLEKLAEKDAKTFGELKDFS
jgi:ATP-dependent DNA helicase RecQ